MYNILYLNDFINYFNYKTKKIIKFKPFADTIENGIIIDIKKFIKCFKKILRDNNIKPGLFYDKLIIIIPPNFSNASKYLYKEIFNNLNFKIIIFKNEISLYKIAKNNINININTNYFYYTKVVNGKTKSYLYNIQDLDLLDFSNPKETYYIYGSNTNKLVELLEKNKLNYYLFENQENYFINKLK